MKNLVLKSLWLILALMICPMPLTYTMQDFEGFNLSDEEKQKLDQELENMVEMFNNLSPEEMQKLEELNKQLEEEMRQQGLDPSNMDDILKWASKEAEKNLEQEKTEEPKSEPITKEPIKAPEFTSTTLDADASAMLLNLVSYISELRQKSISYDEMNKKLERFSSELNELTYFLHSLPNPDLMKHLLSKDFESLYKNLEAFYQILLKNIPLIQAKEIQESDIENPYQALGLENFSSEADIENAYQNLKEMFDPIKIQEQLQKQNIPEQEIAKTIKQAKISFSFIQDAYDELKDQKQKKILDRKIQEELNKQKQLENSSYKAFDEIYKVFTDKLFPILSDIKKLFEKYKPEEISKAKQYDEREKKLLAESKKQFKFIKDSGIRPQYKDKDGKYEEFYKHLAQQERTQKAPSYKPFFDETYSPDFFGGDKGLEKPSEKPKGTENKIGKDGKKEKDKKEEKKEKDEKDEKKTGGKKQKPKGSASKEADKEAEILGEIGVLSSLLEKAEKTGKKAETGGNVPTRSAPKEREENQPNAEKEQEEAQPTEKEQITLEQLKTNLDKYLKSSPSSMRTDEQKQNDIQPLKDFLTFAKQNEIETIATTLKKVTPKGKIESEPISKMLKDKILKHKPLIDTWYNEFYPILDPNRRDININKLNIHRLATKSSSKEDVAHANQLAEQYRAGFDYIPPENLYKAREFIKGMHDSMNEIEKAVGAPK